MNKKIRKAIIPAAGLGTRFLPATKAQPKEMLPIVDKPTIQYIIEEAIASGIEEILIITGRSKKCIEDHFDKSVELEMELEKSGKNELLDLVRDISDMVDIHYIRQKEPRGLGHAIHLYVISSSLGSANLTSLFFSASSKSDNWLESTFSLEAPKIFLFLLKTFIKM